ncbi:MAG: LTA synthase family protein, partial [Pseudobdellovibrionaceae bacterium]
FVLGARFDFSSLCYIQAPVLFVLWVLSFLNIPLKDKWNLLWTNGLSRLFRVYFTVMITLLIAIHVMDFNFYSYFQDRINVLIFGFFEDDTSALISTIWKDYPILWIFSLLFVFLFLLWTFLKKIDLKTDFTPAPLKNRMLLFGWIFVIFLFNGLGARGSLGMFPLTEIDTGFSKSSFVNKLSYGSAHAFSRAIKLKKRIQNNWNANLKYFGYQDQPKQAFADFFRIPLDQVPVDPTDLMIKKTKKNLWAEKHRPHVLVFVMESFGGYYLQYNRAPFDLTGSLQKHMDEDTYSQFFLSSAQMTIGSIGALMIGSHHRMLSDFLTESEFLNTRFRTSPALTYKSQGYKTKFVYGGNSGWRDINKFAELQGFDEVLGEQEIIRSQPNKVLDRHDWGVHDEDVFHYIQDILENAEEPQFIMVLTTTNHPPYDLPKAYKPKNLEIPSDLLPRLNSDKKTALARFEAYAYANEKLADFIDGLKKNHLVGEKTILGVTGDHTFWIVDFDDQDLLNKTSVPFYLYLPQEIKKKFPQKAMGAHSDIFPTLYELSLSEAPYYTLSQDLFTPTKWSHLSESTVTLNYSRFIGHHDYAVFIQNKDDWKIYQWAAEGKKLLPIEKPTDKEKLIGTELHLYYKSLMSVTDYFFHNEKVQTLKGSGQSSN